jgi:hypothetical protein
MPRSHLLPIALLALLAVPAPALAGGTLKREQFTARVSGSYKSTSTVTNTQCRRLDAEGNASTYTGTGTSSETTTFAATKGALFEVSKTTGRKRLGAGGLPIPIRATMKRTSTLDESTSPKGCDLGRFPLAPNCGTKRKAYKLSVFGTKEGGFAYNFSSGFSTTTPDDPFTCPLGEGAAWFGRAAEPQLKISRARLFGRARRIVASVKATRSPKRTGDEWTSQTTETLVWKLTLVRR